MEIERVQWTVDFTNHKLTAVLGELAVGDDMVANLPVRQKLFADV